jgi:hypothetical protein
VLPLISTSRFLHLCRSRPRASIDAFAPARLICYPHRLDRPSRSFPRLGSLRATLAALPSMSLIPFAPLKFVRRPTRSSLPSRLCLDRSHCPVLAPATLAALPSTRAIPNRDVFYVADPVSSVQRGGARNGPILARCCAREHVKSAIFAAL